MVLPSGNKFLPIPEDSDISGSWGDPGNHGAHMATVTSPNIVLNKMKN